MQPVTSLRSDPLASIGPRRLDMSGNPFGDEAAVSLANALRKTRSLVTLALSGSFVSDRGAWALGMVVRVSALSACRAQARPTPPLPSPRATARCGR